MLTRNAEEELRRLLVEREVDLLESEPEQAFEIMLDFYRDVRATDVELAQDGDMMLYQWGPSEDDDGETFDLDLTRQLICGDGGDDDIWQLSIIYRYAPSPTLSEIDSGQSEWISDPADTDELHTFILESAAFEETRDIEPSDVVLKFEQAG